ncbi:unnamed protein product [Rotaria socialis]|uniref:Uncharacterized protein n=1 Tax=Rotaria socialis TaxID=392032 RepID=A0A817PA91_9BILA|nr:unnamed protein product [Rotaria socialis]
MKLIYFFILTIYLSTIYCLPQVRVLPQSIVLLSSSEVRLKCESSDTPFVSVTYWTHVGQRIEFNPSIIEMHGNELRIYQFGDTAYTQPGAYSCVVSTRYGFIESEPAMLSLPTLDPFKISTNENNILDIIEGNTAIIPCELPNGNPRPIPIFSLDNNRIEIETNSNRYKILPSGNLHIIDVKKFDSGKYQCSAKNLLTEQIVNNSQITILQVLNRPSSSRERQALSTVYKPPVASRILVGNNFSIECAIAGWPKPIIEWEKYGDVLPEKRSQVLHGTLYLFDIRLDDRGTYICRASSSNGQSDIAYTALLEVLEPPKMIQRPDSLIQITKDETLSIKCSFRGRPEPTINWLYNGEEFTMHGSPITDGVLSLTQAKEGIYQCIGRNPYGIAQANAAVVFPNHIKSKEKFEIEIPLKKSLIIFGPNNITAYEGETVQLHCLTQPGSTVQWLHNNEIININVMRRYEMLSSGGLRIVSAQKTDSGIYKCIASKADFGIDTAKCFVQVRGLRFNIPVSKLEIIDINQIDNYSIKLFWKINETIENYLSSIQIQHRLIHPKTSWTTIDDSYNRSMEHAIIDNLQQDQTYKFRLIGYDATGKQLVISAAKQVILKLMKNQPNPPIPQINEAWITNDQQINLKWQLLNNTDSETIDGFVIYYRAINSKVNFTTITVPNLRYPPIDTYTITSVEPDQIYELRMTTYSNLGVSPMSNSIEISIPKFSTEQRSRTNQLKTPLNLDEILENITKIQYPPPVKHNLITQSSMPQKSSDILYLIIGIIAGVLLILIMILIAMCVLRLLQQKKLIAHVKSGNASEYYCEGLHKNLNPEYATTPCFQHGVVSVDGKLIPVAYPTNAKSPKIYHHASSHNAIIDENGTIRLNINPINRLDNDNTQENFYHTLTPFNSYGPYEEYRSTACSYNKTVEHPAMSSCVMHHRLINYSSDTLPLKVPSNSSKKTDNHDPCQIHGEPFSHLHYHHGTCQRQYKGQEMITPLVHKVQQHDACDKKFSSSSVGGGHYCTHSSSDSTRPLLESAHQEKQQVNDNFQHSAPPSTGSSSSSSGVSSSIESPYNHWKYLTPLSVNISNDKNQVSSTIIEPIPLSST